MRTRRLLASATIAGVALVGCPVAAKAAPSVSTAVTLVAPTAPTTVQAVPVRTGVAVAWSPVHEPVWATSYHVQRSVDGDWLDVSPSLPQDAQLWADPTIAPGTSADYRVVGENTTGRGLPSSPVTATAAVEPPATGTIDAITQDVDPGGQATSWGQRDLVISSGISSDEPSPELRPLVTSLRQLSAADGSVVMPALLLGPGRYAVDNATPTPPGSISLTFRDTCLPSTGELDVRELSYGPDATLETLSAGYLLTCPGDVTLRGEIRWHSTDPYAVSQLSPSTVDAGRVPVGDASSPVTVTVSNPGTAA